MYKHDHEPELEDDFEGYFEDGFEDDFEDEYEFGSEEGNDVEPEGDYPFDRPCRNDAERAIVKAVAAIDAADGNSDLILQDYTTDEIVEAGNLLRIIGEEPFEHYLLLSACLEYSIFRGPREQVVQAINLLLRLGIVRIRAVGEEEERGTIYLSITPDYNPWYILFR